MAAQELTEPGRTLGNKVDRVLASQASHDMAAGRTKVPDLAAEIHELGQTIEAKLARKRQIEARLGQLNGKVLGAGWLPPNEYREIVQEQSELKQELGDLLSETSTLRLKIDKMRAKEKENPRAPKPTSEPLAPILREIVQELKYIRSILEK